MSSIPLQDSRVVFAPSIFMVPAYMTRPSAWPIVMEYPVWFLKYLEINVSGFEMPRGVLVAFSSISGYMYHHIVVTKPGSSSVLTWIEVRELKQIKE